MQPDTLHGVAAPSNLCPEPSSLLSACLPVVGPGSGCLRLLRRVCIGGGGRDCPSNTQPDAMHGVAESRVALLLQQRQQRAVCGDVRRRLDAGAGSKGRLLPPSVHAHLLSCLTYMVVSRPPATPSIQVYETQGLLLPFQPTLSQACTICCQASTGMYNPLA